MITEEQELWIKKEMKNKDIENQISQKINDLTAFKLAKQTEIDEHETIINGEIQDLKKQIEV